MTAILQPHHQDAPNGIILFRIVERFIVIGRAILDTPHRKVSTIVFLSSIVEVLPLFTSMGITKAIGIFIRLELGKIRMIPPPQ